MDVQRGRYRLANTLFLPCHSRAQRSFTTLRVTQAASRTGHSILRISSTMKLVAMLSSSL